MLKIEYEIKLNESGRPCIDLPEDYEHRPEDKFFVIEMTRYFLQVTHARMTSPPYDQHTIDMMDVVIRSLGQLGDEMAEIQWNGMITMGEIDMMFNKQYHTTLNTLEELNKVGEYLATNNKIYKRSEGLKILILENSTIYEFKDDKWSEANVKKEGSSDES